MPKTQNGEQPECRMLRSWSLRVGAGMLNKNTAGMTNTFNNLNADVRGLRANVVSYDFSIPCANVCIGHGIS